MNKLGLAAALLLAVYLSAITGCGNSLATVSGSVTFDGKAVEEGLINFYPSDGQGVVAGGPIANGKYSVADIPPGKKKVEIIGTKKANFASSSEEMMRRAQEQKANGNDSGLVDPADEIAADDEGNNQEMEFVPGKQTKDFALKKKAK